MPQPDLPEPGDLDPDWGEHIDPDSPLGRFLTRTLARLNDTTEGTDGEPSRFANFL